MVYCVKKGHGMDGSNMLLEKDIAGQGIFVGRYTHSLDPKRRLTIPSGWRSQVGEPKSLYILPHVHDCCLCVIPAVLMQARIMKMRQHSIADRKARQFARVLASRSDFVFWDSQGRIRIKDELLDSAQITDKVVLIGAFDSFELWSPDNVDTAVDMDKASLQEAAEYAGL